MAETDITFDSASVTFHASLRLPDGAEGARPAALLLAGSGPTDRNGDSALLPGEIGTLHFLADVLEERGFVSLRFDKLGSGETGIGALDVDDIAELGFTSAFVDPAAEALRLLARQSGVDPTRLIIIGHSDGALVGLELARRADTPNVYALALLEPLAVRLLDLLSTQINHQLDVVTAAGQLPETIADELRLALSDTVESLRTDGSVPENLPGPLQNAGLVRANAKALAEEDALNPRILARELPSSTTVLTSCSEKDIQISTTDIDGLDGALAHTQLTSVRMTEANHVLKDLGGRQSDGQDYVADLPWSQEFSEPFHTWLNSLS